MSKQVQRKPPFRGVTQTIDRSIQTDPQTLLDEKPLTSPPFETVTGALIVKDPPTDESQELGDISVISECSANMKEPNFTNVMSSVMPSVMPMGSRANLQPTSPDDVKQSCESPNYYPTPVAVLKSRREKPPTKNSYLCNDLVPSGKAILADNYVTTVTGQHSNLESMVNFSLDALFTDDFLQENQEILEQFIKQPSTKLHKCYYIRLEFILRHPIFRRIVNCHHLLLNAILKSKSYHLTENNYVGKISYIPFPIRELPSHHTIIVGGIVDSAREEHVIEILLAFGKLRKIVFDSGVQSVDRQVMLKLALKTEFVHFLMSHNGTKPLLFGIQANAPHYIQFRCVGMKCQGRQYRKVRNGYFCDNLKKPSMQMCLSCAGERAKAMIDEYRRILPGLKDNPSLADYFAKHRFGQGMIHCCGTQFYAENYKSAIVVFDSHKQASQCLFVLRRLSICGLFATHYHEHQLLKQQVLEESLRDT